MRTNMPLAVDRQKPFAGAASSAWGRNADCHSRSPALRLGLLHSHGPRGRARGGLHDGFGRRVVFCLAFDKRFHTRRWHMTQLLTVRLCHAAPVVRCGAGFRRHKASFLLGQQRYQTRSRQKNVMSNRPSSANAQTCKLPFVMSIARMLIGAVINMPFNPFRKTIMAHKMPSGWGITASIPSRTARLSGRFAGRALPGLMPRHRLPPRCQGTNPLFGACTAVALGARSARTLDHMPETLIAREGNRPLVGSAADAFSPS